MKKAALLLLLVTCSVVSQAQYATYLAENFDVDCVTSSNTALYSSGWLTYNPPLPTTTIPSGVWTCTPTDGRPNGSGSPTPGMQCTGVWSSIYHLDTSYLVSPDLDLLSYTGTPHLYLHFDTKQDSIFIDSTLHVLLTLDTPYSPSNPSIDLTPSLIPGFSIADSLGWVTHQTDLISYISLGPFYIAFRYVSNNTSGSIWYLDNVNTSVTDIRSMLNTAAIDKTILPLAVLGNATSSQITVSFGYRIAGPYQLAVYDMMGRAVHSETVNIQNGAEKYTIDGLNLAPGMYFIKMGDGNTYGATKAIIQ